MCDETRMMGYKVRRHFFQEERKRQKKLKVAWLGCLVSLKCQVLQMRRMCVASSFKEKKPPLTITSHADITLSYQIKENYPTFFSYSNFSHFKTPISVLNLDRYIASKPRIAKNTHPNFTTLQLKLSRKYRRWNHEWCLICFRVCRVETVSVGLSKLIGASKGKIGTKF